jgi:hypothetical protein
MSAKIIVFGRAVNFRNQMIPIEGPFGIQRNKEVRERERVYSGVD